MSGIAGIAKPDCASLVRTMLDGMGHRGTNGSIVREAEGVSFGAVAARGKRPAWGGEAPRTVRDETGPGRFARATAQGGTFLLERDPIGVAPLYYGHTSEGCLCFASEAKPLLPLVRSVQEMSPGATFDGARWTHCRPLTDQPLSDAPPEALARQLRSLLEASVAECMAKDGVGSWLSGGLDSSILVALACQGGKRIHTFAGGLAGAPDLVFARQVAEHVGSQHHEVLLTDEDLQTALPEVICSLESFDAWLVRSSVVNHLVGKAAASHVDAALSGEGGDELFGGYAYLKAVPLATLQEELADITSRLHNTALQRVDRCASWHGLTAHTCFLDPRVVALAFQIPAEFKIRDGVEKWILRRAMDGLLPSSVLERPKAKFWEGAGVEGRLAEYAAARVSDADFRSGCRLSNGWELHSKEEFLYHRLFQEHFGKWSDLAWMGRTKGSAPTQPSTPVPSWR